jgi:hypothetical protein
MRTLAFDFETYAFAPGVQIPKAVCMSYAVIEGEGIYAHGVLQAAAGVKLLSDWLASSQHLVGAETAFDVLVSVAYLAGEGESLLAQWAATYDADLVTDVLLRQKLQDLASGCYRFDEVRPGFFKKQEYSLDGLARRHRCGELDKQNPWRVRYGELDGLPIEQYPPEAYNYALEDALATARVYLAQQRQRVSDPRSRANFPGLDPLIDEFRQARGALALKAMSAYGLRTDPTRVDQFEADIRAQYVEVRDELVEVGLVRREEVFDRKAQVSYLERNGFLAACTETKSDGSVKYRLTKKHLTATGDPLLAMMADRKRTMALPFEARSALHDARLIRVDYSRNTKAAMARQAAAYDARGLPIPRTDSYDEDKHEESAGIRLDSDACEASQDDLMRQYSLYTTLAKTISNDIPTLRSGSVMPIHTRYEPILETGRTSSSKPNVQNWPRLPGVRECAAPRAGNVFIDADYPMLELHTLGQVCLWVLGWSYLSDALKAGKDPHLQMASTILGEPYEDLKARKKEDAVSNARTAGKGVNFGVPGGLGPDSFVSYAWRGYKIRLTHDESRTLIGQYKSTWIEMPHYFEWISEKAAQKIVNDEPQFRFNPRTQKRAPWMVHNIVQPWSGRLRAGAEYCASCNSPFQGLGSDVAKVALWLVFKAAYGVSEKGRNDPLYGCRPVLFVHDSITCEAPEERAPEAAERLADLLDEAHDIVLPAFKDAPNRHRAEPCVTRQLSKKAETWRDETGRLKPWDVYEACAIDLNKYPGPDPEDRWSDEQSYLIHNEWPGYVIDSVLDGERKQVA